jgi:hypothetical protein
VHVRHCCLLLWGGGRTLLSACHSHSFAGVASANSDPVTDAAALLTHSLTWDQRCSTAGAPLARSHVLAKCDEFSCAVPLGAAARFDSRAADIRSCTKEQRHSPSAGEWVGVDCVTRGTIVGHVVQSRLRCFSCVRHRRPFSHSFLLPDQKWLLLL